MIFIVLYCTMIFPAAVALVMWRNADIREWLSKGSTSIKGRLIAGIGALVLGGILLVGLPLWPLD